MKSCSATNEAGWSMGIEVFFFFYISDELEMSRRGIQWRRWVFVITLVVGCGGGAGLSLGMFGAIQSVWFWDSWFYLVRWLSIYLSIYLSKR